MKLKTKLTALCAVLLLGVAVSLTAAMLWQVREQSYSTLLQNTQETMEDLVSSFSRNIYSSPSGNLDTLSQKALFTYCFRSCGVPGSVLVVNGEHMTASTQIDPEDYLDLHYGDIPQSTRAFANGKHLLILGRATEILGTECKVYLVVDASSIYSQLLQLSGRFALLALSIGLMGLAAVHWLISRTLRPLSELSEAADCIAAGNYSQRVPVISQDEVGVLAKNFNRMALAVETHVDTLQEQNERQKLFIGAVTHELKTPLTSLLLNVNTLQSVYLPEEKQAALLESMDTQLHWLETMVKKLLTLLSMKKNAKLSTASVPELLNQVQTLTKGICEKYGVSLNVSYSVDTLSVDKDLMCSALVNLVENSAKASKPGGSIEVLAVETGFIVSDHGRGIPEKDLQRVTDPFYMGDPSRSKANGGFGLGLALVREIASVHGGTLELDSTVGEGTTVRIVLPEPQR